MHAIITWEALIMAFPCPVQPILVSPLTGHNHLVIADYLPGEMRLHLCPH